MHVCIYAHTHVSEPRVNKLLWEKRQTKNSRGQQQQQQEQARNPDPRPD